MIIARSIVSSFALIGVAATTAKSTGINDVEETVQKSFSVDERNLQFGRNDLCRCQAEWEDFYFRSRHLDQEVKVSEELAGDDEKGPPAHRSLQFYDPDDIVFDDILRLFVVEGVYVMDCLDRRHLMESNATNTSLVHHDERDLGQMLVPGFSSNIFRMDRTQGIGYKNSHPYYGGANYPPRANTFRGGINVGQPQVGFIMTSPYYGGSYDNSGPAQGPRPMMTNPYNGGPRYPPRIKSDPWANNYFPPTMYKNIWPRAGIRQGKGYSNNQGKGANIRQGKGGGIRKGNGRNDDDRYWHSRPSLPPPSPSPSSSPSPSVRPSSTPPPSFIRTNDICNDFEFGYPVCCFDAPACRRFNNNGDDDGINQPFGFECSTCPSECDFLCAPIPEVLFCNDFNM